MMSMVTPDAYNTYCTYYTYNNMKLKYVRAEHYYVCKDSLWH